MPNGHHGNWNTSSSGGSYGGGEDFGSPFGGGAPYSPPSTTSEANVSYDPGPGDRGGDTPVQTSAQIQHAQQMKQMAESMKSIGQIGGGLSGGTYTKGPVVYPKEFYTHEGWAEVQKKGWSDKLANYKIQGKTPSQWILAGDDPSVEGGLSLKDVGGQLQTLPEGVIYSSNIGDPERGYGGFKKTSLFNSPGGGGSGGYGYGYGYGGGGGGGGGGGYGYGSDDDPLARGYQRGKVGPGGLLEAVNQLYFRLSGMNKKRGGILGLLRL